MCNMKPVLSSFSKFIRNLLGFRFYCNLLEYIYIYHNHDNV